VVLWQPAQSWGGCGDPWVAESTDLTRVFISSDSIGGNMTHHLTVRFGSSAGRMELAPPPSVATPADERVADLVREQQESRGKWECTREGADGELAALEAKCKGWGRDGESNNEKGKKKSLLEKVFYSTLSKFT